jgi:HEPN domain-containing protein
LILGRGVSMGKKNRLHSITRNPEALAEGHLKRAEQELASAKQDIDKQHYAKSVHSSQTCIELSLKSIYRYFGEEFTPSHELRVDEFTKVMDQIPDEFQHREFSRLFILANFWIQFYGISKYGHEKIGIAPDTIFDKDIANLAVQHAELCQSAAKRVRYWYLVKNSKRTS